MAEAHFRLEGSSVRIGHGYDVHRLVEGRRLILGGVEVPFDKGLLGHSDADVLTHAVIGRPAGRLRPWRYRAPVPGQRPGLRGGGQPAAAGRGGFPPPSEGIPGRQCGCHRAGPGPKTGPLSGANAPESGLAAPGAGGRCQRQGHHRGGPWLYRHGRRHCRPCRLPGGEPSVTGEPDAPPVHTLH